MERRASIATAVSRTPHRTFGLSARISPLVGGETAGSLKRVIHRRLALVFQCALFAFCLTAAACKKASQTNRAATGAALFTVDVVTVAPQPFRETLFATGSLLAREAVNLRSERAGVVKEIRFEEGSTTAAGAVLVLMDDVELQAQLARVQAQLELASALETRQRDLLKTKGISEAEYEQSQANLHIAQAEERLIQAQLAKTRIVAPFDGVAGLRQISVGAYLTPGDAICSFQDISALKIDFTLPERYLPYIKTGQKVMFRISGRSETFDAVVAAIEPSIDVATRSLQVRAMVPNEEQRLLPGSFAEVEVVLDEITEAILIPPIALIPGLKQQSVFVHRNGEVEERKVESGLRLANAVQIVEGLKPGDELITSGILQLRPGMRVQVKRQPGPVFDEGQSKATREQTSAGGRASPIETAPVVAKGTDVQ